MKEQIVYSIAPEIFEKFPQYVRGITLVNGTDNSQSSPPELIKMLRLAESHLRAYLGVPSMFSSNLHLQSWREAYRTLGINPNHYRPSVEALARRLLHETPVELPLISPLVDMGNIVSVRHLVPIGVHSLELVESDLVLRLSDGTENFKPFGSNSEVEHPNPGEIIFADGDKVLTRRWTWRQSTHTLTLPQNRYVVFNVDGLPPVDSTKVSEICSEITELVSKFCGGIMTWTILSAANRSTVLNLKQEGSSGKAELSNSYLTE